MATTFSVVAFKNATLDALTGVAAAIYFAHQRGLSAIRDKALAGVKKLTAEGAVREATALLRIANPKVDKAYKRGDHRKAGSDLGSSGRQSSSDSATGGGPVGVAPNGGT